MPYFFARAAELPGVGEATATTSPSCDTILIEAAWISASNCEPIIPTFTLPLLDMYLFSQPGERITRLPIYAARLLEAASPRAKALMYAALHPQPPPIN